MVSWCSDFNNNDRQSPRLLAHHVDVEHVLVPEVGLGGQDPGDGEVDQLVDVTVSSRREYTLPGVAERVEKTSASWSWLEWRH